MEDEPPILRSICRMTETLNENFTVTAAAEDGGEAIRYLEEHGREVDVLFVDMNLPVVNGRELLEYVTGRKLRLIPVVISGYTDYEYMKSAISNNAMDYLRKPLNAGEMKLLLGRIEERCRQLQFEEKEQDLKKALMGESSPARSAEPPSAQQEYSMVLLTFGISCGYSVENEWNFEAVCRRLGLEEKLSSVLPHERFWIVDGKYVNEKLIFVRKDSGLDSGSLQQVLAQLDCRPLVLTTVYYREGIRLENILPVYRQLQRYTRDHMFFARDALFVYCTDKPPEGDPRRKAEIDRLVRQCSADGMEKIYACFIRVLALLTERPVTYREAVHDIRYFIFRVCAERPGHREYFELEDEIQFILENYYTAGEIAEAFREVFRNLFGALSAESGEKDVLAGRMKDYLDANFRLNITSQMLAECFGFAPSYLSSIFKQYYGVTPVYYMVRRRMEEGKRLLAESGAKIKDVARMLGYEDSLYFSKVFKKIVGMSPKEYVRMAAGTAEK